MDKALQAAIDNGATKEEALRIVGQEFDKIKNTDTFLEYLAYNT